MVGYTENIELLVRYGNKYFCGVLWMNKLNIIFAVLCVTSSLATYALTPEQFEHEKQLTTLATDRCNTEQVEGDDYSITALADGKIEVKFLGKNRGELKGTFIYDKSEWEGRQRVLKEHQAEENVDRRKCIRDELASLRETYKAP